MSASPPWIAGYQALTRSAALVHLGKRTQIELAGADRATFLHNLCTADIRKLAPARGCEAFLTSVHAKVLAHLLVFVGDESIILSTVPDMGETVVAHLDHYLVSERVTIDDRTDEWWEVYLGGPQGDQVLARLGAVQLPSERLGHSPALVADQLVWIRKVDWTGPDGFVIASAREHADEIEEAIQLAGAEVCPPDAFEAARIERGFPLYSRDITDRNLPQEVARDALAISFTKGCYLGQETVARIDALGHVNQTLVAVKFSGNAVPPADTTLTAGGQPAGHLTSTTYSPRYEAPLALAYVRRGHNAVGSHLQSDFGDAEVVALDSK